MLFLSREERCRRTLVRAVLSDAQARRAEVRNLPQDRRRCAVTQSVGIAKGWASVRERPFLPAPLSTRQRTLIVFLQPSKCQCEILFPPWGALRVTPRVTKVRVLRIENGTK